MRKPIIAGNWKMNLLPNEGVELVKGLAPLVKDAKCEVVVCPTYTSLHAVKEAIEGTNIKLGAQNVHFEDKGAYTGEVSADMLIALGVEYIIIGHSERREYFNETDETVNKKVIKTLSKKLTPILCCGETLEQRESGVTNDWVAGQIKNGLADVSKDDAKKVVIAYEPIWAIGTGKTATKEEANDTIAVIRQTVENMFGKEVADVIRIQYGGSMNPKNVSELMGMEHIDGGLIGGASLKAEDFSKVINY